MGSEGSGSYEARRVSSSGGRGIAPYRIHGSRRGASPGMSPSCNSRAAKLGGYGCTCMLLVGYAEDGVHLGGE